MRVLTIAAMAAGCVQPLQGQLPAGVWGGEHYELTVGEDGVGALLADCAHGTSAAPLVAADGALSAGFDWYLDGGPSPTQPTQDPVPMTLDATVDTANLLEGTLTFEDGSQSDISVALDQPATVYRCL